ncbi:type VI secretion system FHA domain protein [Chitinivorax tropicus]|uniref:Type VI secretion system FHA domain protein n=1 Tax=Chitinivorax tropicus TaxID=714531 RepID=A0A840MNV2_9PROT|nr:type VI secretion system-associated FHA domain protein TagH [Chitinivorax tropicus]MBB5018759.1 type VI secretion system FHA domain protein [Chitinivorax tropicus]
MSLTLRILTYRNEPPAEPVVRQFGPGGGMIGRAPGSDLELPDPGKYVSRTHAQIACRDQIYYLTDVGSNPTLINDRPLGTGHVARLNHGDLLTMGDYVLRVSIMATAAPAPSALDHPLAPPPVVTPQAQPATTLADPLAAASVLSGGLAAPSAADPLGLNLFGGAPTPDMGQVPLVSGMPPSGGSQPDHVPPQQQPFQPTVGGIPLDYDPLADHGVAKPTPKPVAPPPAPPQAVVPPVASAPPAAQPWKDAEPTLMPSPPPRVPPAAKPAAANVATPQTVPVAPAVPTPPSESAVFAALLRGLGMASFKQGTLDEVEIAELVGQMLREAMAGAMLVLRARAAIKRELRSDMTMIQARGNNPLKFLPDVDSALTQMLTNTLSGYLSPVAAISGAFDDLKDHELAVMAGVRAVISDMLNQLNPALIEATDSEAGMMDKMMPANRKARLWDRLTTQHAEMRRLLDDDFQKLFGDRFTAAYEEQLARLRQK